MTDPAADRLRARFSRAAISHEWLTIPGGSEKVVLEILELLPHAEIFTTVYDAAPWSAALTSRPVHPSFLDPIPGDAAFEFDLADFDVVVSSNHSCAKNVITGPHQRQVCYCHTPMRHAWDPCFLHGEVFGVSKWAAFPMMGRIRRQGHAAAVRGHGEATQDRVVAVLEEAVTACA